MTALTGMGWSQAPGLKPSYLTIPIPSLQTGPVAQDENLRILPYWTSFGVLLEGV